MFTINLNKESAATLLRCLGYGEAAISTKEEKEGLGKLLGENISLIRRQVCHGLSREILQSKPEI